MTSSIPSRQRVWWALALLGSAALLFGRSKHDVTLNGSIELIRKAPNRRLEVAKNPTTSCETSCQEPSVRDLEHFDGDDLLQPKKMLERLRQQRQAWMDNHLKKDYGEEHMKNLFMPLDANGTRVSVGYKRIFKDANLLQAPKHGANPDTPDKSESPGWDSMVRKFQMKLLQVQLGIIEERLEAKNLCLDGCLKNEGNGTKGSSRRYLQELGIGKGAHADDGLYSKFTWVTAGHSSSAGHGNLFHESYTATMERALKPILKQIGLDFQTRPYSMGGHDSGEELALCMNSIYGRDVDTIFWDFALTDGRSSSWKLILFAYKAAAISKIKDTLSQPGGVPHRPALFIFNQRDDDNFVLQKMQELGLTTLGYDDQYYKDVIKEAIPEMMGLTDDQIKEIPRFLRYFKCEGAIESGDPGCGDDKWNSTICPERKYRVSWHPGWKYHGLIGNLMAMTLLDLWENAIEKLIELESPQGGNNIMEKKKKLAEHLAKLDEEEERDYRRIFESAVPDSLHTYMKNWWKDARDGHLQDLDLDTFLKEPSFCHSALLPSEIRFRGFLTENVTSSGNSLDPNSYEHGVPYGGAVERVEVASTANRWASKPYNEGDKMLLVETDKDRQICEEIVNVDYKDFFYVSSLHGKRTLSLPNDSEAKHYTEFETRKAKGLVLVCLMRCDWGKCPDNEFHNYFGWMYKESGSQKKNQLSETDRARNGELEITINGERVTEASDMSTCYALKNRNGHIWRPNANGKYEIQIQINGAKDYSFIRISSFILL